MSMPKALVPIVVLSLTMPFFIMAASTPKKLGAVQTLSEQQQLKLALSAAPAHIAKEAAVLVFGADGTLKETRPGTNGFACIPAVMNLPIPDPMCMDAAAKQWLDDVMQNAPKPSNTVPGIAYMAAGGSHWEKKGEVLMKEEPGAKAAKEPPHWMIMWPFDSKTSMLPKKPNPSGVYIMFDGTPYAHLMIDQDPKKMK
jgi:hypothetical protein